MKPTSPASFQDHPKSSSGPRGGIGATMIRLCLCAFALCASLQPIAVMAAGAGKSVPTRAEVSEKKSDLQELRGQIATLRKEVATAEGKRASAADQLKNVEQEISATQRELNQLTSRHNKLQGKLRELAEQSQELGSRLDSQQAQLEKLVYHQYLQGSSDSLRLLLNGDDPNQLTRDLYYLAAVGRERSQMVRDIEKNLERKQALAADTRERARELATVEEKQKEQHGKLVAQREQRKAVLEQISAKIAVQRREIGNLQRDEKQLTQLIARLSKMIAAKPAPRSTTSRKKAAPADDRPAAEIRNENTPTPLAAGSFARLKGQLRLPTRGVVTNRFGGKRQEGSTWKGVFIRAGAGDEVKAIAGGEVVFADWMRGFGNLMIVDHGGNYLSIYGNNEALLKQVGDSVAGGDTIAAVGITGGNPESGLYFELRHKGQPLDPLSWVRLK
jgi:septal ring factor EnvC (AmiA/AmiB activator)